LPNILKNALLKHCSNLSKVFLQFDPPKSFSIVAFYTIFYAQYQKLLREEKINEKGPNCQIRRE
jgi:hypothetical protein